MNIWNQEIYRKAWYFATKKHTGQKYGGAEQDEMIDYLNHIGSVVMEVFWLLQNTKEELNANLSIQCAILHDTIEDTDTNYDELKDIFGNEVAEGVQALTKNENLQKNEQMSDSLRRIKLHSREIMIVKMADRISNLDQPPYYWDNNKKMSYIKEAEIIYSELKTANSLISSRLRSKIDNYHKFIQ